MMGFMKKAGLTGAPAGNGCIDITGTDAATANTLHAAVAGTGADDWDEVWLVATNGSDADRLLTLLVGEVEEGPVLIPARATYRVLDGHPLQDGLVLKAFADDAGVKVRGYVNQARSAA